MPWRCHALKCRRWRSRWVDAHIRLPNACASQYSHSRQRSARPLGCLLYRADSRGMHACRGQADSAIGMWHAACNRLYGLNGRTGAGDCVRWSRVARLRAVSVQDICAIRLGSTVMLRLVGISMESAFSFGNTLMKCTDTVLCWTAVCG